MEYGVADDEAGKAPAVVRHDVWWAGVMSRSHIPYGVAWLRELLRRESGEVALHMFPSRSFHTSEEISTSLVAAELDDPRITVYRWDGAKAPRSSNHWLLSTGAVGIKPWLRLTAKHPFKRLTVVVIDEGLGTYGNWKSRHDATLRQGGKDPQAALRTTAVEGATRLLTHIRWPLHVQTSPGRWALNKPVADEFRRIAPAPDRSSDRVVFLTQPWPEVGVISEVRYAAHVEYVARAVKSAGLDFVVAPHPGEPAGRYARYETTPTSTLAECNPLVLGAKAIVGASSTAMLNVAAIHGVPALRVGTQDLSRLDYEMAPNQRSLLGQYAAPSVTAAELGRRLSQGFGR